MHSVLRAVKAGIPIGSYLCIAMTTVGHRFVPTLGWYGAFMGHGFISCPIVTPDLCFCLLAWNTFVLMELVC